MAHDEILGGFRVRTNNGKGNRISFDWLWCKWFFERPSTRLFKFLNAQNCPNAQTIVTLADFTPFFTS